MTAYHTYTDGQQFGFDCEEKMADTKQYLLNHGVTSGTGE